MDIVNTLLLMLLGLSVAVLSLFFVLVIGKNVRQGRIARRHLADRLESLNFAGLLKALGLDLNDYLHHEATYRISQNMDSCEACASSEQCQQCLKQSSVSLQELDFCPNHARLSNFIKLNQAPA